MSSQHRMRAAALVILATMVAGSCKSSPGGPDTTTPASVQVDPATGLLVSVGDTLELTATVRNQASQSISATVTWAASPDGVVTVDAAGRVVAVANGVATVTASAGTATGNATVTVEQVADTVEASGDGQAADVTMPLDSSIVVTLLDARGNPVLDAPVSFTVVSGGGTVTPTAAATAADGSASAEWTLGTDAGLQEVDVVAGFADEATYRFGANGYALAAATLSLYAGDGQSELALTALAAPLQVQVLDTLGNGVAGVLVTFGVGGDAVLDSAATYTDLDGVASMGLTLGSSLGTYAATALVADSLTESGTGLDGSPVGFTAEAVAYSVAAVGELVVGDTVTVSGTGFHPTLDQNSVLLGGEAVPILSGSQTELTVEVPGFGCSPQRGMALDVSRTGEQVVQQVTVTPADALALAVGERRILSDSEAFCLQFLPASDDEYLVGLTSTSWFDGGSTFAMAAFDSVGPFSAPSVPSGVAPAMESPAPVISAEEELRAREQTLVESVSGGGTTLATAAPSPAPAAAPLEGDVLSLRLPDLRGDPCLSYVPISAEVFWVGSRLALATSAALPTAGSLEWAALQAALQDLQLYDLTAIDLVVTLLGLPAGWDGESRVTVVFTPEVSLMGLPAYASAVDELPRSVCPSSDEDHYIYVAIPDAAAVADLITALTEARPEILHHFSHVVQWTRRLASGGNLLPSWVAEGQAQFVVEQVGLFLSALQTQTELTPGDLTPPISTWAPDIFDRLARYQGWDGATGTVAGAPEGCSVFGFGGSASPCGGEGGAGAAWALMRYMTDRFTPGTVGGEEVLHQAIVDLAPTADLVAELETLLGVTLPDLVVDFAGMLYADGRLTPAEAPLLQMDRWDLQAMFPAGPKRLAPETFPFGDFARAPGWVVGGGTAYTLVTSAGAHGSLALEVDDGVGGALAGVLGPRLWVLRMR